MPLNITDLPKNMKNQFDSIKKVYDWLEYHRNRGPSETLAQRLREDNERCIPAKRPIPFDKLPLNICQENKENQSVSKVNSSNIKIGINKWTLVKNSKYQYQLEGQLVNLSNNKIITENTSAGYILKLVEPTIVKTIRGTFSLIGNLCDPGNLIPKEVKRKFNGKFPEDWKHILSTEWNDSKLSKSNNSQSTTSRKKTKGVKDRNVSGGDSSLNETKDQSSFHSVNSSIESEHLEHSEKELSNKNLSGDAEGSNNDTCSGKQSKKTDKNKGRAKKANTKSKNSPRCLSNWTLLKDANEIILKGCLIDSRDSSSNEAHTAGPIISVLEKIKIETVSGIYFLVGSLCDPDNCIPENIKNQFSCGLPKSWHNIVKENWAVDASSQKPVKKLKQKTINDSKMSTQKSQKTSESKQLLVNNVKKGTKRKYDSKLPVRTVTKPHNKEVPVSSQENMSPQPKNAKKFKSKTNVGMDEENENCEHEQEINETPAKRTGKNGIGKKGTNRLSFNKKSEQAVVNSKSNNKKKVDKGKLRNKGKNKKKQQSIVEMELGGIDMPLNATSDIFSAFDNCCESGVQSFKEISLGETLKNAITGNENAESSAYVKNMYEALCHSTTSNQSTHSAPSSPDQTMKKAVAKRVQKLQKGKGKKNDDFVKNLPIHKKPRGGNSKVNAVYKQMIKKNSVHTATPKIVKKVFRTRTPRDEDDSMLLDSSENESDLENLF